MTHYLALAALAASSTHKAASKTSSGSDYSSLIFLVLIALAAWLLFFRPRSRQAQQQRQLLSTLSPGDEVLTGAGIYGTVLDVYPDRITIETAPGTRMTVARSTVSRRIEPTDATAADQGTMGDRADVDPHDTDHDDERFEDAEQGTDIGDGVDGAWDDEADDDFEDETDDEADGELEDEADDELDDDEAADHEVGTVGTCARDDEDEDDEDGGGFDPDGAWDDDGTAAEGTSVNGASAVGETGANGRAPQRGGTSRAKGRRGR